MNGRPTSDLRRRLPSVDRLLGRPEALDLVALYGRALVTVQAREELARVREAARGGAPEAEVAAAVEALPERLAAGLARRTGPMLRRVLNATGILLHTNLGRAALPREVAAALPDLLDAACDLEMDLDTGARGERNRECASLLTAITGAEAAIVANNNAGALTLALAALARDREVVVSRGELVEIGGSFRIPEILEAAGARLVEVGTTNRTRLSDFERAVGPDTGALLKVHPSNYRIVGFTEDVAAADLASLAAAAGVPLVVDEGAGLLEPDPRPPLAGHPSHRELLAAGAGIVCGSGDKLLGGPQAGILVGRRELVDRCHRHPLYRALRPGRLTFAALAAVLRGRLAGRPRPLDRLRPDPGAHEARLVAVAAALGAERVAADAFVGGGAAPEEAIPGEALALEGGGDLLARLRRGDPPVVGYVRADRVVLDLRTVDPADDEELVAAVRAARESGS